MRAGMLVIVDEASMASTAYLDALLAHATTAGAKLVLVGDHHQLGAVEAGGGFALLAETTTEAGTAHTLDALWRFTNRWEADATRALRTGDARALDAYAEHGRLHDGDTDTITETAYRAWHADLAAGKSSLLIAPDRDTVTALNLRARADRLTAGQVGGPEAALHDGTGCAPGDWITTRQNDRHLRVPGTGHVRNGANWTVTAVHADGSIEITPREHLDLTHDQNTTEITVSSQAAKVRLPARYVAEHVELGYATTIHRSQGATVDTAHAIVTPRTNRQALYVAMTRGRNANHAYIPLDGLIDAEDHQRGSDLTGRQILERVLATDGTEHSATTTLRHRQNEAGSLRRLHPIHETIHRLAPDGPEAQAALIAINGLIAASRNTAPSALPPAGPDHPPTRPRTHRTIDR